MYAASKGRQRSDCKPAAKQTDFVILVMNNPGMGKFAALAK